MSARYTGAERFLKGKGIVAEIADSNLPKPLREAVRQMKKLLSSRLIHRVCPRPPFGCFMFQPPLFCAGREILRNVLMKKPDHGEMAVVEPDEMWRFLKSKKFWIWKACCRVPVNSLTGNAERVIRLLSTD